MVETIELLGDLRGDLTQEEWARRLGVSQPLVALWLSGQRRVGVRGFAALARAYPERLAELLRVITPDQRRDDDPEPTAAAS